MEWPTIMFIGNAHNYIPMYSILSALGKNCQKCTEKTIIQVIFISYKVPYKWVGFICGGKKEL